MTDARRWMEHGTQLFLSGVTGLDDAGVAAPSGLPGWGRRHLLAHVAANAEALRNLVHWAETGEETPMYASSDARARGIEEGSQLPAATLLAWPRSSAEKLGRCNGVTLRRAVGTADRDSPGSDRPSHGDPVDAGTGGVRPCR